MTLVLEKKIIAIITIIIIIDFFLRISFINKDKCKMPLLMQKDKMPFFEFKMNREGLFESRMRNHFAKEYQCARKHYRNNYNEKFDRNI